MRFRAHRSPPPFWARSPRALARPRRPGEASCHGKKATIVGGKQPDRDPRRRHGTQVVVAGGGSDTIITGKGSDVICGGDGNDRIMGGKGTDRAYGTGDDVISNQKGKDSSFGGRERPDRRRPSKKRRRRLR
jgi:Ca2+-binding RTX toxin-like protein